MHLKAEKLAFGPLFRLSEKPKYEYRRIFKVLRNIFFYVVSKCWKQNQYRINDLGVFLHVLRSTRLSKRREGSNKHTMEGRNRIWKAISGKFTKTRLQRIINILGLIGLILRAWLGSLTATATAAKNVTKKSKFALFQTSLPLFQLSNVGDFFRSWMLKDCI